MNFLYQVKFVPLFVGQQNFADVFILLVEFRGAHQLVMRRSKVSLEEYLKPHGVLSDLSQIENVSLCSRIHSFLCCEHVIMIVSLSENLQYNSGFLN